MNRLTELAESVLDYWFAIEFLSQDKYPNSFEIQNIVKKHKQEVKKGEEPPIETQEDPMPQLITDCMNALYERGMEPTIDKVKRCILDKCENDLNPDKTIYNECIRWIDNNLNIGGI